jgi:hypothetical protein
MRWRFSSSTAALLTVRCISMSVACCSKLRWEPHSTASSVLPKIGTTRRLIRTKKARSEIEIAMFPAESISHVSSPPLLLEIGLITRVSYFSRKGKANYYEARLTLRSVRRQTTANRANRLMIFRTIGIRKPNENGANGMSDLRFFPTIFASTLQPFLSLHLSRRILHVGGTIHGHVLDLTL